MRRGGLREEKHTLNVCPKRFLDFFGGKVPELLMRALERRIVHQHIEPTERVHRAMHQLFAMLFLTDIAGNQFRTSPG
jgi:hypothetical protein